jgi:hypothetical protein
MMGTKSLLFQVNSPLHNMYLIIYNIFLPYNLVEDYVFSFWQEKKRKKRKFKYVVEGLIM